MIKAVLMDRDGTIIREKPGTYLAHPGDVKLYKNTLAALRVLKKAGYTLFVVSNQSGIGRGYFSEAAVKATNKRMVDMLRPAAQIKAVYFCPHAPGTACDCRKPAPGMGAEIIKKYKVDAAQSFMIGDKKSDIDFGRALGMQSVLVLTANGRAQRAKYGKNLKAAKVAADLLGAAKFIARSLVFVAAFGLCACSGGQKTAPQLPPAEPVLTTAQETQTPPQAPQQIQNTPQNAAPKAQPEQPGTSGPKMEFDKDGRLLHPWYSLPASAPQAGAKLPNWFGESLKFKVGWAFITAGEADLITGKTINTPFGPAYAVEAHAKSYSVIDKVFKVRDINISWIAGDESKSYGYWQSVREGHYMRDEWVDFDYAQNAFTIRKQNNRKELSTTIIPFTGDKMWDMLSALYHVRAQKLPLKGEIYFDIINANKQYPLKVIVHGKETVKVKAGKFDCIVVEPLISGEGIFVSKGRSLKVWLTDDERKMPVKMSVEVFIGAVHAELVSYSRG